MHSQTDTVRPTSFFWIYYAPLFSKWKFYIFYVYECGTSVLFSGRLTNRHLRDPVSFGLAGSSLDFESVIYLSTCLNIAQLRQSCASLKFKKCLARTFFIGGWNKQIVAVTSATWKCGWFREHEVAFSSSLIDL